MSNKLSSLVVIVCIHHMSCGDVCDHIATNGTYNGFHIYRHWNTTVNILKKHKSESRLRLYTNRTVQPIHEWDLKVEGRDYQWVITVDESTHNSFNHRSLRVFSGGVYERRTFIPNIWDAYVCNISSNAVSILPNIIVLFQLISFKHFHTTG